MFRVTTSKIALGQDGALGAPSIRLWGYKDREFVASGNKLSSRVALLIYLCQWRSIRWLLEQPDGSMLPHLPRFQQLWQKYDVLGLFSYVTVDPTLASEPVVSF